MKSAVELSFELILLLFFFFAERKQHTVASTDPEATSSLAESHVSHFVKESTYTAYNACHSEEGQGHLQSFKNTKAQQKLPFRNTRPQEMFLASILQSKEKKSKWQRGASESNAYGSRESTELQQRDCFTLHDRPCMCYPQTDTHPECTT